MRVLKTGTIQHVTLSPTEKGRINSNKQPQTHFEVEHDFITLQYIQQKFKNDVYLQFWGKLQILHIV